MKRKKAPYLSRQVFRGIVFLFCAVASFLFISQKMGIEDAVIPMPTVIDSNFSTQINECFIPTAAIYSYTLRVVSGFRSLDEQAAIYNQGRTVDGHIVSWAEPGLSLHNYGFAVDIVDRWRGYDINFDKLAKIGEYCGLEQVDPPHFEHRAGLTTAEFGEGKRPSSLVLPCAIMSERASASQPLTLKDLKNCGSLPKF